MTEEMDTECDQDIKIVDMMCGSERYEEGLCVCVCVYTR